MIVSWNGLLELEPSLPPSSRVGLTATGLAWLFGEWALQERHARLAHVRVELTQEEGLLELGAGEHELVLLERDAREGLELEDADLVDVLARDAHEPPAVLGGVDPGGDLVVELGAGRTLAGVALRPVAEARLEGRSEEHVLLRGRVARLLAHGDEEGRVLRVRHDDVHARARFLQHRLTPADDLAPGAEDHHAEHLEELLVLTLDAGDAVHDAEQPRGNAAEADLFDHHLGGSATLFELLFPEGHAGVLPVAFQATAFLWRDCHRLYLTGAVWQMYLANIRWYHQHDDNGLV